MKHTWKDIPQEKRGLAVLVSLALRKRRLKRDLRKARERCYRGDEPELDELRRAENEIHNALQAAKMIYYNGELR